MNEQQIRQLVRQEIQNSQNQGQFTVRNIPLHTHNGKDSPFVYSPTNIYTGFVPSDADLSGATTSGFVFFPQGWKVSLDGGTLIYTVTHNLNTDFYTVCCSLYGPEAINAAIPNIVCLPNEFTVLWQDSSLIAYQTDFSFQLVQVNNGIQTVPLYTTRGGL